MLCSLALVISDEASALNSQCLSAVFPDAFCNPVSGTLPSKRIMRWFLLPSPVEDAIMKMRLATQTHVTLGQQTVKHGDGISLCTRALHRVDN